MTTLDSMLIIGGVLLGLFAAGAAALAWRDESSLLAMGDVPTLSVAEVAERHRRAAHGAAALGQPVEVVGTIECDAPLRAPYSETLCVAYAYNVTEESERIIGRPGSRNARELEFGGRDEQNRRVPRFYVHDATGRIAVDPAGARIDMVETVARYEEYSGLGGAEREIWREERALPLGNRVFVLGYLTTEGGAPLIGRHPTARGRRFIISHRDEGSLATRTGLRTYGLYLTALLGAAGAAACFVGAYVL
jgi:hypothetical protein